MGGLFFLFFCCKEKAPKNPQKKITHTGSKEPFSLPGATWERFRCTVEPSPGHIRCRKIPPRISAEALSRKRRSGPHFRHFRARFESVLCLFRSHFWVTLEPFCVPVRLEARPLLNLVGAFIPSCQDFHFLLQNPRTPEGFPKGLRRGSLKGFRRVFEGSSADPF